MTLRTAVTHGTATVVRADSGTYRVRLTNGQEVWLSPSEAVDVVCALHAIPDVARAWLHGGGR